MPSAQHRADPKGRGQQPCQFIEHLAADRVHLSTWIAVEVLPALRGLHIVHLANGESNWSEPVPLDSPASRAERGIAAEDGADLDDCAPACRLAVNATEQA